jgi:hypothetical protein
MVKTFEQSTTLHDLNLQPGDLSGDLISGGTISNFASTGIQDLATETTVTVEDGKLTVDHLSAKTVSLNTIKGEQIVIRGDIKVYGIVDAGFVRTTEIITNQRYEKQYLEFAQDNEQGTNVGTGLLWPASGYNKQLVYRNNPDRFFLSETVDLAPGRQFTINGNAVLTSSGLGTGVTESNLQTVGNLKELTVIGNVNLGDMVHYDAFQGKFAIGNAEPTHLFSVYDFESDTDFYIEGDKNGRARVGTFNNRPVDIVSDDQVRISVSETGDITLGQELRDSTVTRVYGKLSVGIKNPVEQFEVAGNMRLGGKLFAQGDQAPTEGHYYTGDIIWNTNPRPTAFIGWVCTQSGFPGTWKAFGQIFE